MNTAIDKQYPGFEFKAADLAAFSFSCDTFFIALKGKTAIIKFSPDDIENFTNWLSENGIRDIRNDSS